MARSSYIYIVIDKATHEVVLAGTVKREVLSQLNVTMEDTHQLIRVPDCGRYTEKPFYYNIKEELVTYV